MRSRSLHAACLALVLCPGSGCVPSGASFSRATGVLTIAGTAGADSCAVRADASGAIVVNGGAVPIAGGSPTIANTVRIVMLGLAGDDQLVLEPVGGALPGAQIIGGPGTDVAVGGSGDDEFVWAPGDGSDTIEGRAGADTLLFQGTDATEAFDVAANGGRALLTRSLGGVTIDSNDIETIALLARGGRDTIAVGDLSGTEVTEVLLDLTASAGGGDGQRDTISVDGSPGPDGISVVGGAGEIRVEGLPATVRIPQPEPGDELAVDAQGGADTILAGAAAAGVIELVLEGGPGSDDLLGGDGDDRFVGGDGDDIVLMGAGDDTAVWNPGDDDDAFEGQDGYDTLLFEGSDGNEVIEITPNGPRALLFRSIGSVVVDLNDLEAIDLAPLGGGDVVTVEDLSGTDLVEIDVSLATLAGTADGFPDAVVAEGTDDDDVALVVGDASGVSVFGLAAQVTVTGAEDPGDRLTIDVFGGDDVVEASGLATPSIPLTANGGAHHDVLVGGDGDDVLNGGDGDDVLLGNAGADLLDGGSGSNTVIQ